MFVHKNLYNRLYCHLNKSGVFLYKLVWDQTNSTTQLHQDDESTHRSGGSFSVRAQPSSRRRNWVSRSHTPLGLRPVHKVPLVLYTGGFFDWRSRVVFFFSAFSKLSKSRHRTAVTKVLWRPLLTTFISYTSVHFIPLKKYDLYKLKTIGKKKDCHSNY